MVQRFNFPREQVFSDLGVIGAGYKLFTYETTTTTPLTTYSDTSLTSANTNPIIADSAGRFGAIFVDDLKLYKAILKDSSDNIIWTADPVDPKTFTLADFDPRPTFFWGTTGGTASAYTLDVNPNIDSYSSTQTFFFACHLDCNASPTMAINGLTALALKKYDGEGSKIDLEALDIVSGQRYEATNDGVDIIILNPEIPFFKTSNLDIIGRLLSVQTFTTSGVWTKPAGIKAVKVIVTGGGGGGGGSLAADNGVAGGTSSFGAFTSATGGSSGLGGVNVGQVGGIGSGGDINILGGDSEGYRGAIGGNGGGSYWGGGGSSGYDATPSQTGKSFGSGGGGAINTGQTGSTGGAAGGTSIKFITSGLGATETVTVGAGGAGGIVGATNGGAGKDGIVIVYEYS